MFHWITKIIISASIFLGITSPTVSPAPIIDLKPTPTVVVSTQATPTPVPKRIIKSQTPSPLPIPTTSESQYLQQLKNVKEAGEKLFGIPTPTPMPTPIVYTKTQTIAKDFLSNPTLDNLKIFCEKAKSIASSQTKEVLNEDKTAIRVINIPFSETISGCVYLNNSNSGIVFISPTPDSLLIEFCSTDTDTLRTSKIKWNDKIQEYNQAHKLYGFNNSYRGLTGTYIEGENTNYEFISGCPSKLITGPNLGSDDIAMNLRKETYPNRVSYFISINNSLVVPEVEIGKLIK